VKELFDVAVIGGGSAGLAASVTAARGGARVVLIERYGFLGGMGTASLVHTFCGLYLMPQGPDAVLANPGFASEMAERMIAVTGIGPQRMGRVDVLLQHPVEFVCIADQLVTAEKSLELRLHTELSGISASAAAWELQLCGRAGTQRVSASTLIDASGDAVVAGLLGCASEMTEAPKLQRPAYVFGVRNNVAMSDEIRLHTAGLIVEGVRRGRFPAAALGVTFRSSGRSAEIFGSLDLVGGDNAADFDPLDGGCLTLLELAGRKLAAELVRELAATSEFWRGAYISQWPVRAGVRESRRWIGEYILTGKDLRCGVRFADEIALATWPMEFRETNQGPKFRYSDGNLAAGIPLRCLKPKGIERLWVAGRCIATDHEAQASIRVMGTCFATGEAAGRAAVKTSA
jgi:FAD dependent oxidoreductase